MTVKANMYKQMMYPPVNSPQRAPQARPNTLQQHLLQRLHSQLHMQQHSFLQPLHPWPRAEALLACLTQSVEWHHSLLSHLWHLQSANQWPLAHRRLLSKSRLPVLRLSPIMGPLLICALFQCLAIPCKSLALLSKSDLRGPESCGGQSRGSGRSSNRSLARSEI